MEGLGLSDEDEDTLAKEVSIVFHVAATINFQVRGAFSFNFDTENETTAFVSA